MLFVPAKMSYSPFWLSYADWLILYYWNYSNFSDKVLQVDYVSSNARFPDMKTKSVIVASKEVIFYLYVNRLRNGI